MSNLVRIITAGIIAILFTSCNFDLNSGPGISGEGQVITKTRNVFSEFENIKVSRGIDVEIIQGKKAAIAVVANENLHDVIITEYDEDYNMLRISADENIKSSASKKVVITVKNLTSISTTSGASVYTNQKFVSDRLVISSTSGSHVKLSVETKILRLNSTSGAGIEISGFTDNLNVNSTSGSYIKAENLKAESTNVAATSGASIRVNTSKVLTANATTGANVRYLGNPDRVSKNDGISGSISSL